MIPDIGLMIGAYIITRMVEMMSGTQGGGFAKFLGGVTILVTIICLISLLGSSATLPRS